MSDIPDTGYLVRMFCYDEETNEWIERNNEIVNVVLVKRPVSRLHHTGGTSDSSVNECSPAPPTAPAYEYFIQGRHVIDGHIIHECVVDDGLVYVEAGPTFHYCVTKDDKRFGIKFQSIVDSIAFAKAVRIVSENVADDYVMQNEAFRNHKKNRRIRFSAVHQLYTYSQDSANTAAKLKEYSDVSLRGVLKFPTRENIVSSSSTHSTTGPDTSCVSNAARFLCTALLILFILYIYLTLP